MNTEEALTAFATVILVVAIFSIIVFVLAKISHYQRSRKARAAFVSPPQAAEDRTQWSDDAFGVPAPPPLESDPPTAVAAAGAAVVVDFTDPPPAPEPEPQPPPPLPPPPLPVPPPPPAPSLPDEASAEPNLQPPPAPAPQQEAEPEPTGDHWVLGASPFLPTPRGGRPAATSIQRRYWQNLAGGSSTDWLEPASAARLAEGKPPTRVNRRTRRSEELQAPPLNEPGDESVPPRWPSQAPDPFAEVSRD
jgi:hypothetical protein